jgi:hypothetical protein
MPGLLRTNVKADRISGLTDRSQAADLLFCSLAANRKFSA